MQILRANFKWTELFDVLRTIYILVMIIEMRWHLMHLHTEYKYERVCASAR